MGSAAMDSSGNIALGYSASSTTLNPEVRYTSRMASDFPGTMPGGEITCWAVAGVQTSPNRWGERRDTDLSSPRRPDRNRGERDFER